VRHVTIEQSSGSLTELEAHRGGMLGMGRYGGDDPRLRHPRYRTGVDHRRHARAFGRAAPHFIANAAADRRVADNGLLARATQPLCRKHCSAPPVRFDYETAGLPALDMDLARCRN
jgi:hypothetical protein